MQYKVLVVDDSKINLMLLITMLMEMDHYVAIAENGFEAVNLFKEIEFHMILMDYQMPVMDGEEATITIREIEKQRESKVKIPIIAVSANLNSEVKTSLLKAGVNDFISEPIDKEDLKEAILKYVA